MTPQEQQMIDGLISRIRGTQVQNKDTEAEQYLQNGLAGYPDAVYVLAQTVLVQQYGLQQAKAQIDALQQQIASLQQQAQQGTSAEKTSSGSFLSHIFGAGAHSNTPPPQPTGYQPVNNPPYPAQAYPGSYPPPPPAYPPQSYSPSFGGGGGFLSGALQTAAGVAAGEAAFAGIEGLFHGFEHGGGFGGGGYGFGGGMPAGGETVVNNYYDDNSNSGDEPRGDRGGDRDDSKFYNPSDDASRDNDTQFADTGNDDSGSGIDDNSGFDGGQDFGGGDDFQS